MQTLVIITAEFSADIKMQFGIDKCATIWVNNKYLGILEADSILHAEMKSLDTTEYIRRDTKALKSQLHGQHCIQAINTWAVPVVEYGAGILSWKTAETRALNVKTCKVMRIHRAQHPQGDVDRL